MYRKSKNNSNFTSKMKEVLSITLISRSKNPLLIKKPFHKKKTSQVHVPNFSLIQEINVVNRLILP